MRPAASTTGLIALVLGLLASTPAGAVEGDLTLEVHWLDAIQGADHTTMRVTETHFFNNTGSAEFSGNLSFQLPEGAQIASGACSNAPSTAARIREALARDCFFLVDMGGGLYEGTPFVGAGMSYYGQRAAVTLHANSSLGDEATLLLNVTAGVAPTGQAISPPDLPGLYLATNRTELGAPSPPFAPLPANLTYLGNLTVHNRRGQAATVNLSAAVGGATWAVTFLDGGVPLSAPPLLPANATKRFDVRVVVPNYLAQIEVDYVAQMASVGNQRWSFHVDYPYPLGSAQYFLFLLESDNTTGSAPQARSFALVHSAPTWQESMKRWWFFYSVEDIPRGGRVDIQVFTEVRDELSPLVVGLLAVVAAAVLVGLAVVLRRRRVRRRSEEGEATTPDSSVEPEELPAAGKSAKPAKGVSAARADVTRLRDALARIEHDHARGRLPDESYTKLKASYEAKIRDAEAKSASSREASGLLARKERVLKAIQELRAERAAGTLDADTARELEAGYREEAVALMKRLDKVQE